MIKAAVIGDPISHSLSPKIHQYFLKLHNIKGSYEAIKVTNYNLEQDIVRLINLDYKGFNVTLPHKESVRNLCHHLSNSAKLIGAVNTILITKDKKIFGHNSDAQGFIDNIKYHFNSFSFKGKNAFIIGAGGAARAVIYGLIKEGCKIYLTNRNEIRAQKLINDFNSNITLCNKSDFEKNLNKSDILVNASSLGMENMPELQINLNNLNKNSLVTDIVYKPLMTNFLINAKNNGNNIVTGIGMLLFQALIGFEMWYGKKITINKNSYELIINDLI